MTTIREELMEATSLKQKKKEDDSEFISRLSGAVEDLDEEVWDKLSTEAQEFHNSVASAKKNDADIPSFPDEASEEVEEDATEDAEDGEENTKTEESGDTEDEGTEDMKEKKPKKKPAAKSVAKKPAKAIGKDKAAEKEKPVAAKTKKSNGAKPVKTEKSNKKVGIISRVRQLVIKNPNIGIDDLVAKLEKDGYKGSKMAISTTKQATRDVLKMLVAAKMLDMEL